jgi:hypothetical protein
VVEESWIDWLFDKKKSIFVLNTDYINHVLVDDRVCVTSKVFDT